MTNLRIESTEADNWCLYPIAQQVVGAGTIAWNFYRLFEGIVEHINDLAIKIFYNHYSYEERLEKRKTTYQERLDLRWNLLERAAYDEDIPSLKQDFYSDQRDLTRHCLFMIIGIIRMTPVVGSVYSFYQLNK